MCVASAEPIAPSNPAAENSRIQSSISSVVSGGVTKRLNNTLAPTTINDL